MQAPRAARAVAAARSTAAACGLRVDEVLVLHDSSKLTLRLLPCDVVARVAPVEHQVAELEIRVAQRLAELGSPVAALDRRVEPRVHERDGFAITLWTFYETTTAQDVPPADYARALRRLHTDMRALDLGASGITVPHVRARVEQARRLVADRERTPGLGGEDRQLLAASLRRLGRVVAERPGADQLLHGEPHPGNLLAAAAGPLFIDFETCCRGPVEFDLVHAPDEVGDHYPDVDRGLLHRCRLLVLAMITTWRWDRDDELPDGRELGIRWLHELRAALPATEA